METHDMLSHVTQLVRLLVVLLVVLALAGRATASDPDQKLLNAAQSFLENEARAKSVLDFAHFGATYRGVETRFWQKVVDDKNREITGYFALTVRYYWAGLLSDNEHTDVVFFFDNRGRFYALRSGDSTSKVFKPFELAKAVVGLTKEVIRAAVKDSSDKQMKELVETAITNVDAEALLRLKLILEQPGAAPCRDAIPPWTTPGLETSSFSW